MASVVDKIRKKNKATNSSTSDWSRTGTFINKPAKGWLHPDDQLDPSAGICYGVRYIGCMEVKVSMRSLDFETRTAVAKESISRVCDAAGLKTATKRKKDKKVAKMLGDHPNMRYAGSNVNLTITTESLLLLIMETGELLANHEMPGISFASGGDADTMDFVAYVAKDPVNKRACHVLECGGGLAQDVITTVGQAFELRFKEFLKKQPRAVNIPDRLENPIFGGGESAWGEEPDYYNDRPGAMPPAAEPPPVPPLPTYSSPQSNLPVSDGMYSSVKERLPPGLPSDMPPPYDNGLAEAAVGNLLDLTNGLYDNPKDNHKLEGAVGGAGFVYDNTMESTKVRSNVEGAGGAIYNLANEPGPVNGASSDDPFDMKPFNSTLPHDGIPNLEDEEWYHGPLTRIQAEELLHKDGDFLVRESTNSPGQYVLSGMRNGKVKHLLLVDPQGVVRTKDREFVSVSHLISHHMSNKLPIMSQESELVLMSPVSSQC